MTLVIFLAALIGGMLIGLPICFALLFSGVCMMLYLNGFNAQILSQNLFSGADSFSMMAVPFFCVLIVKNTQKIDFEIMKYIEI